MGKGSAHELESNTRSAHVQCTLHVGELYNDHSVPANVSDHRTRRGRFLGQSLGGAGVLRDLPHLSGDGADLGTHRRP